MVTLMCVPLPPFVLRTLNSPEIPGGTSFERIARDLRQAGGVFVRAAAGPCARPRSAGSTSRDRYLTALAMFRLRGWRSAFVVDRARTPSASFEARFRS